MIHRSEPNFTLQTAADLFAAAARRDDIPASSRLHCLAAEQALDLDGRPLDAELDVRPTDELITKAVQLLSEAMLTDGSAPSAAVAAGHGRRALRGQF